MDIIAGINEKNNRVFKTFFEKNFSSVVMFADKYLDDMEVAADIAQECFIRLWHGNMTFESEDKVKGFLYTTARNLALNELKHDAIVARYVQKGCWSRRYICGITWSKRRFMRLFIRR